ncbi:cytochrome c biogenesis heme-transporting ATPase CcmA [Glaciecola petra]|uniref:Cytochrome c biogenesis heme-transporting ATPase CcmA n=1 Tax=Glaciecola petra TaxID=3075602 RepID=A0ABU2ZLY4_9ALTE|nr:cytochrome c biogenesis heme-transporting ATPase CcmA [Aestuariibacter sp. P117]MDT0593641.1 cytochrome c biogenesis heme-transporting ATPase CcmA [Aestuariibacter sp. P117]
MNLPILDATNICCEKQDRILFQDIDLTINSGELVFLRGENGAGKTSLLRILVGLGAQSAMSVSKVTINGHCVKSELNLAGQKLIYCGHKLGFSGLLSAQENLQYWMSLSGQGLVKSTHSAEDTKGQAGTDRPNIIIEVLQELGLAGLEEVPVKQLSAGQQRRVGLAKLWLHKSSNLWVLDEPFTALDTHIVSILEAHITQFLKSGGAVLMTSHQQTNIDYPHKTLELEYMW